MLYAKVVFGLPVEGPFDYIIPDSLDKKIKTGCRIIVPFGSRKRLGYVVRLAKKSGIKNIKSILQALDEVPVLNKNMLLLTKRISDYFCCSWGEAIETALPAALRKGKAIAVKKGFKAFKNNHKPKATLVCGMDIKHRWANIYLDKVREALDNRKSVIILLPDMNTALKIEKIIRSNFNTSIAAVYRNQPGELKEWIALKEGRVNILIGTRSNIFAPLDNLGLIIIDEEESFVYKQDQVPHYNTREVGFMRSHIDRAALILGSSSPSLESMYLARKNRIEYKLIPRSKKSPEIRTIDMKGLPLFSAKKNIILSKYLEESITHALNTNGKILIFLNRRGFATIAACFSCGTILKCERCNINLVFHYKENSLRCHYCNFRMAPPKICPHCDSGYIRYGGMGTEKIESELSRLFPQSRIRQLDGCDDANIQDAEIFISTQSVIKERELNFDLIAVLSIDNSLNRADLRAGEKAFDILAGLVGLSDKKIVIQTNLPQHHLFKALMNKDMNLFYDQELKQRKELGFPPYRHLALVKLRGKDQERVKSASLSLFEKLKKCNDKSVEVMSLNPGYPSKLRANFYWQVLIRARSPLRISKFLKTHLSDFSRSGIIVTVDVDPL